MYKFLCTLLILFFCTLTASAQEQRSFKDYVSEPSFKLNAAAAVTEFIAASTLIDGKKVREGHPLITDKSGGVLLKRAGFLKALAVVGPYFIWKWNKQLGRLVMYAGAIAQGVSAAVTVAYRF